MNNNNNIDVQATRGRAEESFACKDSSKMRKKVPGENPGPVVMYMTSPKIIKVRPEEFKGLVQRLTGNQAYLNLHPSTYNM